MKNALLKFAGLFVERVPVDEHGNRIAPPLVPRDASPQPNRPASNQGAPPVPGSVPPPATPGAPAAPPAAPQQQAAPPGSVAVALRAWVPQEYAAHLAPFGIHVIAAGGSVTSEQARAWGATVLVLSAECLGQDVHLLQQPQLPTVFITPQPMMIPDVPGVVQVQEPLRASDVAHAVRDAATAFAAARR